MEMRKHTVLIVHDSSPEENWGLLRNILEHNFHNDTTFSDTFRLLAIEDSIYEEDIDYWFFLYDAQTLDLYASCSLQSIHEDLETKERLYEVFDVFVEEKFRGNNYSVLLLLNMISEIKVQVPSETLKLQIRCNLSNETAFYAYQKVFGKPKYIDESYIYFTDNF